MGVVGVVAGGADVEPQAATTSSTAEATSLMAAL
jgi:hypothetical protein